MWTRFLFLATVCMAIPSTLQAFVEPAPGFALRWGGGGSGPGKLLYPLGITCDAAGNVYVADYANNRVQKFTANGEPLAGWGGRTSYGGFAYDVAVDNQGHLYVAEYDNDRITKFTTDGVFLGTWGSRGTEAGQFRGPDAIDTDSFGNVYVVDGANQRIQKFSPDGQFITTWGSLGSEPGQFYNPAGIAVDQEDRVYVSDLVNHRIQVFDSSGSFLLMWGSQGTAEGQFEAIWGLEVDSNQRVYVADSERNCIMKFDANGVLLTEWGWYGNGEGYFHHPSGVAVGSNGCVFVTDSENNFVQKFEPSIPPPDPRPDYVGKILLHVTVAGSNNSCSAGVVQHCSDAVTKGDLSTASGPFYNVFLLLARGTIGSLSAAQFGITYDGGVVGQDQQGIDIFSWTRCAQYEFHGGEWPGAGSGNMVTWDWTDYHCQLGEVVPAGYFYLAAYSPDVLKITPRPVDDLAGVGDCVPDVYYIEKSDLGFASFSDGAQVAGCNPCFTNCESPTPVISTTWSRLKTLYK